MLNSYFECAEAVQSQFFRFDDFQGPHSYRVWAFSIWSIASLSFRTNELNLIGCDKSCDIRIIYDIILCQSKAKCFNKFSHVSKASGDLIQASMFILLNWLEKDMVCFIVQLENIF